MKKLVLIIMLNVLYSAPLLGQSFYRSIHNSKSVGLQLSNQTTRSIYGFKTGLNVGVVLKSRWNISYMHLISTASFEITNDAYQGVGITYTFNPNSALQLQSSMAIGIHNRQFIAVQPTIRMRYDLPTNLFISIGFGRSDGFPFFDAIFGIVLFKNRVRR